MAKPREIANNLQMDKYKISLNTDGKDKLYLVANGALYEIPLSEHGRIEGTVIEGKIVDLEIVDRFRVPGRSRRIR